MQAGRLEIGDGEWLDRSGRIVEREHVLINRRSGQVAQGALFKFFGLQGATFHVDLVLRNFELWHLALVGSVLKDLSLIPLGSGRNKGYGRVEGKAEDIRLSWFGAEPPDDRLRGVADHPEPSRAAWFQQRYRIFPSKNVPELPAGGWKRINLWRFERALNWQEFETVWSKLEVPWSQFRTLAARVIAEVQ
jgi:hypothetical protein